MNTDLKQGQCVHPRTGSRHRKFGIIHVEFKGNIEIGSSSNLWGRHFLTIRNRSFDLTINIFI